MKKLFFYTIIIMGLILYVFPEHLKIQQWIGLVMFSFGIYAIVDNIF